jgi:hypothetical protein
MTRSLAATVTAINEAAHEGRPVFLTPDECRDLTGLIANGRIAEFHAAALAPIFQFAPDSRADTDLATEHSRWSKQVRDFAPGFPVPADRGVVSGAKSVDEHSSDSSDLSAETRDAS